MLYSSDTKFVVDLRGFLSRDEEVLTRLAHKASKEVLTKYRGKKTARQLQI